MFSLIFSVLCSTALILVLSQFNSYKIHTFQAIVVNYIVCVGCAWLALGEFPLQASAMEQSWFFYALFLGLNFIVGFNMVAGTVQHFGVPVTSVMQKMSLVMVLAFTFFFYHEKLDAFKTMGLVAAFGAIWYSSRAEENLEKEEIKDKKQNNILLFFPILTLLLSGIIDVTFYYVQRTVSPQSGADLRFIAFLFGTAGAIGFVYALIGLWRKKFIFSWRNVTAGIVLGIPNFGSTFFFLRAMNEGWEGSVFFPINNVGIIVVSTLAAVFLLREKLNFSKKISIVLSLISIILIALSQ